MPFSLIWLSDVLKKAGLKVAPVEGWEDRAARGKDMGDILGVICHHTAGPKNNNMPSLHTLIHGHSHLSGPLCNLGLGRDGTYYLIAAGKSHHAGKGIWKRLVNGNSNFIGIEAENTGRSNDFPWPEVQMDAYRRGVAAILAHIRKSEEFCCGHKEYALPMGRKPDPSFDMITFRASVADILNGKADPVILIPPVEPDKPGASARPTLRRGASGDLVKQIQEKLSISADGTFGPETEAALRAFQRNHNLVPDGIVGPKTWTALDAAV